MKTKNSSRSWDASPHCVFADGALSEQRSRKIPRYIYNCDHPSIFLIVEMGHRPSCPTMDMRSP
jgi:hypothetical protein